jgi:hypothetical protein
MRFPVSTGVLAPVSIGDKAKSWLDLFKEALTIIRDLFLAILFIGFLFFPKHLNKALSNAGITSINGGVFQWQPKVQQAASQNASAAQDASEAASTLQDVKADLQTIAGSSSSAATKQAIADASSKIDGTLSSLDKANTTLASSYLTQQSLLQSVGASTTSASSPAPTAPLEGWVNVGRSDAAGQAWATPPQPKIDAASPYLKAGQTITFTDDLFVRGDKPTGGRFNQGTVLGAVRAGTTAQVLEVEGSHAKKGGEFVWVKVRAAQGKG